MGKNRSYHRQAQNSKDENREYNKKYVPLPALAPGPTVSPSKTTPSYSVFEDFLWIVVNIFK